MKSSISPLLKKHVPILLGLAILAACNTPPDYPIEPIIEFIGVSKDTMKRNSLVPGGSPFRDTTFITFSFTDGDGDIGDNDSLLLFLADSRESFVDDFRIPYVQDVGGKNGIKGEITVRVFTSCCIFPPDLGLVGCEDEYPPMPYDVFTYDIYIKDRAGHQSNTITTTPIYIECFD